MLFTLALAFAGPLEIVVDDSSIQELVLNCEGRTVKIPVENGLATTKENLGNCTIQVLRPLGAIQGNDKYRCNANGCVKAGIDHLNVPWADGRLVVVLTDKSATMLELTCPGGYRARTSLDTNTAIFDAVPQEDCTLYWKNGAPARAQPIRPGRFYCQNVTGTGVCRPM